MVGSKRLGAVAGLQARRIRRRAAVIALRLVPLPWLLRLRAAHLEDRPSALPCAWRRAVLRAARVRGIPQREPFEIAGLPGITIAPVDSRIAAYLFWLGINGHEPGQPAWWASLTASHGSVLELGANIGVYTLVGAAHAPAGNPYRAVEANPTSIDALATNLALNGFRQVQVVGAAAVGTRAEGTVALHFPASDVYDASSGAFVERTQSDSRLVASRQVAVPTVCISDLIPGVDLMKLDVEGLELEVLGAVRSWIVRTMPTLVIEVLDESQALQCFLADVIADVSYLCVVVRDGDPVVVDHRVVVEGRLQTQMGTRDVTLITSRRLDKVLEVMATTPGSHLRATRDAGSRRH